MRRVSFDELEIGYSWEIDVRYNGALFTGIAYHESQQSLEEAYFVEGAANGPWTRVSHQGQLLETATYKDGHPVGQSTQYFSDGSKKAERLYDESGRLLLLQEWNEQGTLILDFSRDERIGHEYEADGTLRREIIYGEQEWVNGKFHAWQLERRYDRQGKVVEEIDHAAIRNNMKQYYAEEPERPFPARFVNVIVRYITKLF